jgi:sorting nexin-4
MDQHDDFDSVSWKHDADSDVSRPTTSGTDAEAPPTFDHDTNGKRRMSSAHEEPQAGALADAVDLAGIGDGVLECRVDTPLKENEGTKDTYISYLVTTSVSTSHSWGLQETCDVRSGAAACAPRERPSMSHTVHF